MHQNQRPVARAIRRDARPYWIAAGVLAVAMVLAAGHAKAGTATQNVNVTATVNATCNASGAATDIAFGTIPAFLAAAQAATGSVQFTCNKGAAVTLTISNGNNNGLGQSAALRAMKSGTNYISYHIFQPTGATFSSCVGAATDWPAAGVSVSSLWAANGGPNTINLCGSVDPAPATGYAVGASYADLVVVTATF
jgi:spore coat protein U-like protein